MIKGVIMQIEAESKLGYNSKMAPETKTSRRNLFSTMAISRMSSAVKSAFCEPSHSISASAVGLSSIKELPNWGENYLDFPHLPSHTEFALTNNNKNMTRLFSSFMPHRSPNLKKYSTGDLDNNSWKKRKDMMTQRSILDHLNRISIGEQHMKLVSDTPVVPIDIMKCVREMDVCSQTRLVIEHIAHTSSHSSSECVNESGSMMDVTSASCCSEQGGGVQAAVETGICNECACGVSSPQSTDTCHDDSKIESETKISLPACDSCGEELTNCTSLQNCERSRTPGAPVRVVKATSVCGHRKKKTRPSAKKRHRRKRQCGAEDRVSAAREETKSQNRASAGKNTSDDAFLKDLTDSIDIAEQHLFGSKKAASPSSAGMCSLFISASELFDEPDSDTENFQNCSDDDIDFDLSDTPAFVPSLSSCDPLLAEVGCMFVFDVTSPCSSDSDALSESQSDDEKLWMDPEMKQLLDDANKKWEENYGCVDIAEDFASKKVQFPSEESDLQTVFILTPDEASKEARIGHWQVFARDRQRFRHRIAETERAISYCLEPVHREKIHQQLYGQ